MEKAQKKNRKSEWIRPGWPAWRFLQGNGSVLAQPPLVTPSGPDARLLSDASKLLLVFDPGFGNERYSIALTNMPRYYFNVRQGDRPIPDIEGHELVSIENAWAQAAGSIGDMVKDTFLRSGRVRRFQMAIGL